MGVEAKNALLAPELTLVQKIHPLKGIFAYILSR